MEYRHAPSTEHRRQSGPPAPITRPMMPAIAVPIYAPPTTETRAATRPTVVVAAPVAHDDDELMTVKEVAALARVATETVRRHVLKGALPVVRIGPHGRLRVRRAGFRRYLGS